MNQILRYGLAWVGYVLAQVLFFDYLLLFRVAIPFVFVLYFLTLPFDTPRSAQYLLAFVTGIVLDLLSHQGALGLHSLSLLLIMGAREPIISLISRTNIRSVKEISLKGQNGIWLASYFLPLIFLHHTSYFLLEALTFSHFGITLLKILSSMLYTLTLTLLMTYLFYKR